MEQFIFLTIQPHWNFRRWHCSSKCKYNNIFFKEVVKSIVRIPSAHNNSLLQTDRWNFIWIQDNLYVHLFCLFILKFQCAGPQQLGCLNRKNAQNGFYGIIKRLPHDRILKFPLNNICPAGNQTQFCIHLYMINIAVTWASSMQPWVYMQLLNEFSAGPKTPVVISLLYAIAMLKSAIGLNYHLWMMEISDKQLFTNKNSHLLASDKK